MMLFDPPLDDMRGWYADYAFRAGLKLEESTIEGEIGAAVFSTDRDYRYLLVRRWAPGPIATFCMLNPSTATHEVLDPTCRRAKAFAQREECGTLVVVNLYGLRSTDPKGLKAVSDPIGPYNDELIEKAAEVADLFVAAWGVNVHSPYRVSVALDRVRQPIKCLGTTKDGHPRHPLYLPADTPLERF